MKFNIDDAVGQLKELKKAITDLRLEIAKNLVSVSSAILAILISLRHEVYGNSPLLHYSYLLFLLCILAGLMLLYGVLKQLRKMDTDWQELLKLYALGCLHGRQVSISSRYDKFLGFLEKVCIFSFFAALVMLIMHSFQ